MKQVLALCFLLVILACVNCLLGDTIKLVDFDDKLQRYLFRGDNPVNGLSFQVDKLKSVITTIGQRTNPSFSSDYYLVVINLLKVEDLAEEEVYFLRNPKEGELFHWPLVGNILNGSGLPEFLQAQIVVHENTWDLIDKLQDKVSQLQHWIHNVTGTNNLSPNSKGKQVVFYMHDDNGIDQTGELSGAYYLSQFHWSYYKTLFYNFNIVRPAKKMENWNINQLNWYCLYLFFLGPDPVPVDCNYQYM